MSTEFTHGQKAHHEREALRAQALEETTQREVLEVEARRLGEEAGRAAASWYFDGNTTREQFGRVLTGIEDGDPAVLDTFPTCPLSGEWADDPTPGDVLRALGVDEFDDANDDLLNLYEDGYSEAPAFAIEAAARAGYAETDEEEETVRDVARRLSVRFTRRTRDDGTEFTALSDVAPDWMRDVVREAHGDQLPNDWRYDVIAAAAEWIADNDDADDRRDEFADGCVDVYSAALVEWLASHGARAGYVQEAREEFGDAGEDVWEEIRRGQYLEALEVYDLVYRACEERREPT